MIGLKCLRLVLDFFVVDSSFAPLCWPLTGDFSWPKVLCLQGLQSYKRKPEALWTLRQIWSGLAIATQIACILCTRTMPHVSWIKLFQKIVCWPFNQWVLRPATQGMLVSNMKDRNIDDADGRCKVLVENQLTNTYEEIPHNLGIYVLGFPCTPWSLWLGLSQVWALGNRSR